MRILIAGAGLAGLSAGIILGTSGHDVTIVERANRLRTGGSPIDIRGDALAVADRMGVLDEVRRRRVTMTETVNFVGPDGAVRAQLAQGQVSDSPDDIEIAREDLTEILHAALPDGVRLVFGDHLTSIEDGIDAVTVRFASGDQKTYDLIVGADGIHSGTRSLVFGPESDFLRPLGYYVAFADLPGEGDPTSRENAFYNYPGHLIGIARYHDKAVAVATFRSGLIDYDHRDPDAARRVMTEAYGDHTDWRVPELLTAINADPDLYFDIVAQIHMDTWHHGRVVLLGDAAYCASGLSGRGTSLALTGAAFLAEALSASPHDLEAALAEYERAQRPYVTHAQASAAPGGDLIAPATEEAIAARNLALNGG